MWHGKVHAYLVFEEDLVSLSWVCAYANNRYQLAKNALSVSADTRESSVMKAMHLALGV